MEKTDMLYDLCDIVSDELEKSTDKIRKAGRGLAAGDIDYLDKLAHTMKSLKTTIAMIEADGGYSMDSGYNRSNRGGNSTRRRRDSMGRYSRDYSYADGIDGMVEEMRGMMSGLPEEKRREVQRFVDKMEQM